MIRYATIPFILVTLATVTPTRGEPQLPVSPTPLVSVAAASPTTLPQLDPAIIRTFHPNNFLLANKSDKAIVGLMTVWTFTDANGFPRTGQIHTDSFMQPHSPVLLPAHQTLIIAPGAFLPEALAQSAHTGATLSSLDGRLSPAIIGATNIKVQIDLIIFEDGEMVGPNETRFDTQIQNRRIAATQLAKQLRNAIAGGDDPKTILNDILETKPSQSDTVAVWTLVYARMLLKTRVLDKQLGALETLPDPPKFYRK